MNYSVLFSLLLIALCMQSAVLHASVPKNPLTNYYVQTYKFLKPDCALESFDSIVLDPVYLPPNSCIGKKVDGQYGLDYSTYKCLKDTALVSTQCNDQCSSCRNTTQIALNACRNEKDGTSSVTFCGAPKYENIPKMIWDIQLTPKPFESCTSRTIAKIQGVRILPCTQYNSYLWVERKCGPMYGSDMYEVAMFRDSTCTQRSQLVRGDVNTCDSVMSNEIQCM